MSSEPTALNEPECCVCGEPEHSLEHIAQLGGNHVFVPADRYITHLRIDFGPERGWLCRGKAPPPNEAHLSVAWSDRNRTSCVHCQLMVRVAEANNLKPEGDFRARLAKLLEAA